MILAGGETVVLDNDSCLRISNLPRVGQIAEQWFRGERLGGHLVDPLKD